MGCCGWKGTDREPTVPAPPDPGIRVVERHRARAEADLTAATGGAALCRTELAADAKRAEGALAAIAQVHCAARRAPRVDPVDDARSVRNEWTNAHAAAQGMGRAWQDYRAGGVEALDELIHDLEGSSAADREESLP